MTDYIVVGGALLIGWVLGWASEKIERMLKARKLTNMDLLDGMVNSVILNNHDYLKQREEQNKKEVKE